MSRALVIGEKEANELRAAFARARAKPIPWDVLSRHIVPEQGVGRLTLENRAAGQGPDSRPPSEMVDIPYGYRMNISFERQPAGLLAHFSVSVDKKGALPNPIAVEMMLDVIGFKLHECDAQWVEEFMVNGKRGGEAVNLLYMVDQSKGVKPAGRA